MNRKTEIKKIVSKIEAS